jgi:hypothetical protein
MFVRFSTRSEAYDAGYRTPVQSATVKDTSGRNSFGYSYAEYDGSGSVISETVTVWFTEEKNKLGKKGSFAPMFPPRD